MIGYDCVGQNRRSHDSIEDNIKSSYCKSFHFNQEAGVMDVHVQLVRAYAIHMESVLNESIRKLCYGCSVDHLSQAQHDVCLMMSEEEQIYHCLEKCLELVTEEDVMKTFTTSLGISEILRCPSQVYNQRFRQYLWLKTDWVDDVCQEIIRIKESRNREEKREPTVE